MNEINHVVMAPMTRSRAIDNVPNELMATYYLQPYDKTEVHQTYAYLSSELNKLGMAYIHISASPDFIKRIEKSEDLNPVNFHTLYTADAVGYTDYPVL